MIYTFGMDKSVIFVQRYKCHSSEGKIPVSVFREKISCKYRNYALGRISALNFNAGIIRENIGLKYNAVSYKMMDVIAAVN